MKLSEIDKYWHLLEAAREGKTIQQKTGNYWDDCVGELQFCRAPESYRIKPEPLVLWVNEWRSEYGVLVYGQALSSRHACDCERQQEKWRRFKLCRTIEMKEVVADSCSGGDNE